MTGRLKEQNMARWCGVAAIVVSLIAFPGCGETPGEPDPEQFLSGVVAIGVNSDLPGWSEYENGVWQGFDIALANWLGHEIGFQPQFVPVTTDERLTKLQEASDGRTDNDTVKLVIANFSITDQRREDIDFAGPYFSDSQGVMVREDSGIQGLKDIEEKLVCVSLGSTSSDRLDGTRIRPVPENTIQRCADRLWKSEVDALSSDRSILEGYEQKIDMFRVVPSIRFGSERYGVGMPDNRPGLCALLTEKIKKFIDEAWDQKLTDTLPGTAARDRHDRKPNSQTLAPCEKAGS
jgi:glutamate transport system substrate-binding protein